MPVMITHDTSIDYDVQGKGPSLVLISGLGFGRWGWFKQLPTLTRHFRTITFDIRGQQNLSRGVPDLSAEVAALLDHLGVRKTHVLGTSLGGFVAQDLALNHPGVVNRLVLVCTSYGSRGPAPMSPQALGRLLGLGSVSAESAARRGLEAATSSAYQADHAEEFEQILHWRLADSPSPSDYYQQAMAGARFDSSRDVGKITAPTLVIHGTDDRYVPVANATALAEAIPEARLRLIDGAGHLVFIERAEEVNKEIVSFLKPRRPQQRRQPHAPSRKQKILSFFEPRWTPQPQVKHRTKQLAGRITEANEGLFSYLKHPRIPELRKKEKSRKPPAKHLTGRARDAGKNAARRARSTFSRFGERLRPTARVPGEWTRQLRGWLSR